MSRCLHGAGSSRKGEAASAHLRLLVRNPDRVVVPGVQLVEPGWTPNAGRSGPDPTLVSRSCAGWQERLTQGSAERNQFCRRGMKALRWRKIPTRTDLESV